MPATQVDRDISVTSALPDDTLLFLSMSGSEQLGRLSEYRVQLSSAKRDIQIGAVLGKTMGIHVNLADGGVRHFNGVVTGFRSNGWDGDSAAYEATIHPWLWLLTRSANCRIFQDLSVPDIVAQVCGAPAYGGLADLSAGALGGNYAALPYCVQYRETDFNFVCRLLESVGIYFFFTHDADKHTMVLADSYGAHVPIAGDALKFCSEDRRLSGDDEMVFSWSASGEIQSSAYTLDDFDFEKAAASSSGGLLVKSTIATAFDQAAYEMYDYPGGYVLAADGTALARGRMESLHGQCERIDAASNARALYTGGLFTLAEHPRDDQNRDYLVTEASYALKGSDYRSGGGGGVEFQVTLAAIGKEHAFRPLPVTRKPVVRGPQTAMVVGKAGEEIWTDKYGRVKVQFHWDRLGKDDEKSSCWVRVSQSWAGKGWGAIFIPRIGMEVVVEFLEGDPDRPLITGCVYNSDALPPYALPAEQTKSTLKSNSTLGGEGYNELRFEDKKGAEEVYVQAERDFKRVVKNNDTLKVGFETAAKGDQDIAIKNDRLLDVGHDETIKVGNDETITIGRDQSLDVKGDQKVKVGKTIVIEAGTSIELKVGGSSIKIEAGKITIKSAEIEIAADANMKVNAGAMMDVKAGAVMTLAGALVKIN
ncbi:type VI secretion system Vgr family protein [Rugamonas sp.]|uniref:type VI secretion system Vgr family protein n=1 Tax=Rugamonas sp. TaxID=1926287 RepID=UPI0025F9E60C|nr:type VI secretion system tip protein TssI/VgrG [Rugamonas sp.]